jgi:hypothetical protein
VSGTALVLMSMSSSGSAASIASRGLLALPGYEPKHAPDASIRHFLAGSAAALGRSDISHPLKVSSNTPPKHSSESPDTACGVLFSVCSC